MIAYLGGIAINDSILATLQTAEARHKAHNTPIKVPDVNTHAKQYREMVRSFEKQELEASAVQPVLKALLGETITVTPGADGVLVAEIDGDSIYGGVLPLAVASLQPPGVGSAGSGGRIDSLRSCCAPMVLVNLPF